MWAPPDRTSQHPVYWRLVVGVFDHLIWLCGGYLVADLLIRVHP